MMKSVPARIRHQLLTGHTPRWMVFLMDQGAMLLAFLLIAFLREALFRDRGFGNMFMFRLITTLGTTMFFSILYETYSGIIRLSGVWDFFRLTVMHLSVLATLVGINLLCVAFGYPQPYHYTLVCVMVSLSFFLMFIARLAIKLLFQLGMNTGSDRLSEPVLILGSDTDSLCFASMLRNEVHARYRPVAIVSIENGSSGYVPDEIMGMPLVDRSENLLALFREFRCSTALVMPHYMPQLKELIMDTLIDADIRLLVVNRFQDIDPRTGKAELQLRKIQIEDLLGREPIRLEAGEVRDSVRGRVVMVTGAAGSIGSELCRQLASCEPELLICLDQAETPMFELENELRIAFPYLRFVGVIGDVRSKERLKGVFERYRPHIVYHAAAYKHVPLMEQHPLEAIAVNVGGTRNVADMSVTYGVERFVMISTDKAVNPTNVMGASKRIAEIYIQSLFFTQPREGRRTKFITTRFGNVLGSNGSVVPLFQRQIAEGGPVTVTHRDIVRYFMTIPEACNLVLEAATLGNGGEIFVFDMGRQVRIYDLARRMIRLSGLEPEKDIRIVETGLRPGEKLYEELLSDKEHTVATAHEKILIARVRRYDYLQVLEQVLMLLNLNRTGNVQEAVRCMKLLVPEYKSSNSEFEALDKTGCEPVSSAKES